MNKSPGWKTTQVNVRSIPIRGSERQLDIDTTFTECISSRDSKKILHVTDDAAWQNVSSELTLNLQSRNY